jgi:DNA mismatch repair protein MutH
MDREQREVIERIEGVLTPFLGIKDDDLCAKFNLTTRPKSLFGMLTSRMVPAALAEEAKRNNILLKSIRVNCAGRIVESMSFAAFNFQKIILENWPASELHDFFAKTAFLFVVYLETDKHYTLRRVIPWTMDEATLEGPVKTTWLKTVTALRNGTVVKEVLVDGKGRAKPISNFPGMSDNGVCHVRPHAQNASDTLPLPYPDVLTGLKDYPKQAFWLNNSYLTKVISQYDI